ncbi:uncharacterized protein OCT59_009669 [Rhizophagus irregularis]|uniref:uncharacterized protein n=1 Tax=Rhizophagus irregularis TaxID=588596 RepID=UPI003321515E|nr:hypothetical protein OCT59_009669 [Rhizophagus irregularis]
MQLSLNCLISEQSPDDIFNSNSSLMKLMNFFTEDIINHEKILTSTGSTGSTGLSLKSTADAISEAERLF